MIQPTRWRRGRVLVYACSCLVLPLTAQAQLTGTVDAASPTVAGATVLPGRSLALGIGVELGSTTGLSIKYFLAQAHAIEFGVGAGWVAGVAFQNDVSYLYHVYLLDNVKFSLPLFVGAGLRVSLWPGDGNFVGGDVADRGKLGLGAFGPVGVAVNFKKLPLDLYAQLSLGIGVVADGNAGGLLVDGTAGGRFYF